MNFKVEPWKHQLEAIERASKLPWYALLFDIGTGKTSTCINILREKFNKRQKILRTLIFGPPIILQNWKNEWEKYSSIEDHLVVVLKGSQKKRVDTFLKYAYAIDPITSHSVSKGCVFITNFEALLMKDLYHEFLLWKPEAVVNDEAHRVKSHEAKRSEYLNELCNPIDKKFKRISSDKPYVFNLTGTPVLKDALDLFQQYKILIGGFPTLEYFEARKKDPEDAQKYLIKNYYTFRARYFVDANAARKNTAGYFPDFVIKPGAIEEINQIIYHCSSRVEKKECLDLPDEVVVNIKVGMTTDQSKNYAELKKDFVTYVKDERVTVDMAMVKALRLLQITSGFISVDQAQGSEEDPIKVSYDDTPKAEALRELLRDITPHSKVLVWSVWKENYKQIAKVCEELKIGYVEVNGAVSAAKKDGAVSKFKNDETIRVFSGHPGSAGIGINLIEASYSIFFSRNFSLEQYLQASGRNFRGGQTQKVTHYNLVCENTIDELAVSAIGSKEHMSAMILKQSLEKI